MRDKPLERALWTVAVTDLVEQIALAGDHQDDYEHDQPGRHAGDELGLAEQRAEEIFGNVLHLNLTN